MLSAILKTLLFDRPGWTVAIALALLVAIGLVKPVRASGSFAQRAWENFPGLRPWIRPRLEPQFEVDHLPVELYARPVWWRRLLSLSWALVLAIVAGVLLALVLGVVAIGLVSALTGRLR